MQEHIETLAGLVGCLASDAEEQALAFAIELMNAAKPLDEAAEREHCARVAAEYSKLWNLHDSLPDVLLRERVQARAKGYAAGAARYLTAQITLSNQLSAAQAELRIAIANTGEIYAREKKHLTALAVAHSELDTARKFADQLETKLSAAQAEIALLEVVSPTPAVWLETRNAVAEREAQLSAARAELEYMTKAYAHRGGLLNAADRAVEDLTEQCGAERRRADKAQAEIERFKSFSLGHELDTKLTNLRTEAERYLSYERVTVDDVRAFRAAIEASRT